MKDAKKILNEYDDLVKNNQTIEGLTIDIQLNTKLIQQKRRPVPMHFQNTVRRELEKLIGKRHLEKADKTTENCFVSPAVIIMKKNKPVKTALDSRKQSESCIKRKATMPNMEELISKNSAKNTKKDLNIEIRLELCRRTCQIIETNLDTLCIFHIRGRLHWTLPLRKRFFRLFVYPTVFQEHLDKVLEFGTPVWLDDIVCVANGTTEDHVQELREILSNLQNAGYCASEN